MNGLIAAHSGLRWIVLLLLVIAIFNALANKNKSYLKKDKMINLFTMVFFHTQFLVGLVLYFVSNKVSHASGWMKDTAARFFGMEHALLMILAMVFVTLGYMKAKKKDSDTGKHKAIITFFIITLILVIAGIPWPFREALGGSWF